MLLVHRLRYTFITRNAQLCVSSIRVRHRNRYSAYRPSAAVPERRTSFDQQLVGSLEKQLGSRPNKDELVNRNILKGKSAGNQAHSMW